MRTKNSEPCFVSDCNSVKLVNMLLISDTFITQRSQVPLAEENIRIPTGAVVGPRRFQPRDQGYQITVPEPGSSVAWLWSLPFCKFPKWFRLIRDSQCWRSHPAGQRWRCNFLLFPPPQSPRVRLLPILTCNRRMTTSACSSPNRSKARLIFSVKRTN